MPPPPSARAVAPRPSPALGSEDGPTVVRQVTVESSRAGGVDAASRSPSARSTSSRYKGVVEITATLDPVLADGRRAGAAGARAPASSTTPTATSSPTTTSSTARSRSRVRFWDGSTLRRDRRRHRPLDRPRRDQGRRARLASSHPLDARRLDRSSRSATASSRSAARSGSRRRSRAASSARSTGR